MRTLLKGQALDAIRGFQITGANYDAAWSLLTKRYDRTDELVEEYIRKFFEVKPLEPKANVTAIRKIIDYTNQMLRALPSLDADVKNWDPIVNLIVCSKLNDDLRSDWTKQKVTRERENSTYELLDFLENKAIEVRPNQNETFSSMLRGNRSGKNQKTNQRKIFQITDKKKKECLICKKNHSSWDCPLLAKGCAKVRSDLLRNLGLCFKCLLKHRADACDEENCEFCDGPHNILLCFKKEYSDKLKQSSSNKPQQQINEFGTSQSRAGNQWQPKPGTSTGGENKRREEWNQTLVQKNSKA